MDRENVIKGLESLRTRLLDVAMQDRIFVLDASMVANAIDLLKEDCHNCKLECLLQKYDELKEKYDAMLKEQEEKQEGLQPAWQDRTQEHICQRCGGIVWQEDNYCSKCGQAVKWR